MRVIPSAGIFRVSACLLRLLPVLIVAAVLEGCNGGSGGGAVSANAPASTGSAGVANAATLNVTISGSVGDGPVTGSTVTIYDARGAVLGTIVSDEAASFRKTLQVTADQYPLRLVASGGIDLVTGDAPDFRMVSMVLRPSDHVANINPFSTLIVSTAQRMPGGLGVANAGKARNIILDKLGFGLDAGLVPDPVATHITDGNVASIVKASEALGELVRRTRDLIGATGAPVSGSAVITALAADLVDGFVDGLGASGVDATVSAVASVVSAQVLVESMSNSLRVGGVIATGVIDQSIRSTRAGVGSSQLSGSVPITDQMIRQAGVALAAVRVLDDSAKIRTIEQEVASLTASSSASDVASVLPAGTTGSLSGAASSVASASSADISLINQTVFAQGDSATVAAASGGGATGGTTSNSGSGGSTVSTATTGSFTVNWVAPVTRSDGTPLALSAIGGYRLFYGSQRGNYTNSRDIADSTARSVTVANLAAGTYYLVMTTYDTGGLESAQSAEVIKNVP